MIETIFGIIMYLTLINFMFCLYMWAFNKTYRRLEALSLKFSYILCILMAITIIISTILEWRF